MIQSQMLLKEYVFGLGLIPNLRCFFFLFDQSSCMDRRFTFPSFSFPSSVIFEENSIIESSRVFVIYFLNKNTLKKL